MDHPLMRKSAWAFRLQIAILQLLLIGAIFGLFAWKFRQAIVADELGRHAQEAWLQKMEASNFGAPAHQRVGGVAEAAYEGSTEQMKRLLLRGGDPNEKYNGKPALLSSVYSSNMEAIMLLLKFDADPNIIADDDGRTPLIVAVEADEPKIAEILLRHGARVDAVDYHGVTALMRSALVSTHDGGRDFPELGRVLIAHGADVNRRDQWGATPLIYLAHGGYYLEYDPRWDGPDRNPKNTLVFARLLLAHGAWLDIRDTAGKTCMDYAREQGETPLTRLLYKTQN